MNFPLIFLLIALIPAVSCTPQKKEPSSFFERWSELAKHSQGHRPAYPEEQSSDTGKKTAGTPTPAAPVEPPLPSTPVSLKMTGMDIKLVIQALSRAARQNIIINSSIQGNVDINIRNVPWNQAFTSILKSNGLTWTWEGDIIRIISVDEMKRDLELTEVLNKKNVQELSIRMVKLKYLDAAKVRESLLPLLNSDKESSSSGQIVVDSHTNSLIIQAGSREMARVMPLIRTLDKPSDQITLKAFIIETTRTTGRDLGIQWGGGGSWSDNTSLALAGPVGLDGEAAYGSGSSGSALGINFPISAATGSGVGNSGAGLNAIIGSLDGNFLELQLTALESDGKANILSSPTITTMDNQMAFTESGTKIPYVSTDSDGNQEVNFEDAVLRLEITPHVIDDRYLRLSVVVKNDEVDFSDTVEGNPVIRKKQTQTSVIVDNGETLVISGLTKQTRSVSESGVPGLKNIPALGWAFKGDSSSDEFQDVLIFITPTILGERSRNNTAMQQEALHRALAGDVKELAPTPADTAPEDGHD